MMATLSKLTLPMFLAFGINLASIGQVASKPAAVTPAAAEHAATLAESGHCAEALPLLAKAAPHITDKELQKRVGLDGVRCASTLQQPEPLQDFLRMLSRQFPHDPEVLYVLTHAYSDLAARAASELATHGSRPPSPRSRWMQMPQSSKGNGIKRKKTIARFWSKIRAIQRSIFAWRGLSYPSQVRRRTSPSRPRKSCNRNWKSIPQMPVRNMCWANWRARRRIYRRQSSTLSKATQLDPNFADAYLGLGMVLLAEKKYPEAVAPLERAVKLQPANPAGHYSLATAYARTGRKDDAEREFALQQKTSAPAGAQGAQPTQ